MRQRGSWPSPPRGIGQIAVVECPGYQRLAAAVLLQARVDAQHGTARLRAEARQWIATYAGDWLEIVCPPDQDVGRLHSQLIAAIGEAA